MLPDEAKRKTRPTRKTRAAQDGKGRSAIRAELHRLCVAARTVCLYSEDRKFFLHGELYCALATAIGKGGKSFAELARRTGAEFSARQDRGSAQATDGARLSRRAALVHSSPSTAIGRASACRRGSPKQNLDVPRAGRGDRRQRARRIQRRLERSASTSSTRSPDLTVTLVNDYLEDASPN